MPDPQLGQLWSTSRGRTVEILARGVIEQEGDDWDTAQMDVIAYKFLGGSQVHLRAVSSLYGWTKVDFE